MMLAAEIERTKQRELIATLDRSEAALAEHVTAEFGTEAPLSEDAASAVSVFVEWCNVRRVRYCPAKPATVAAFVTEAAPGSVLETLRAISQLHDAYRLANPAATGIVARALDRVISVDPPRSWPKADKAAFLLLPPDIQSVIARRESERDRELRRIQSDAAKRQSDGAAEPVKTEKETDMPKREGWQKGEGVYSNSDSGITQPPKDTSAPKDISSDVDKGADDFKLRQGGRK